MTYELIQAALTNLITFTAIAGFGGIALHAIWSSHCKWMATHCPPIKPYNEVPAVKEEAIAPSPEPEQLTCSINPDAHWNTAAPDGSAIEYASPLTCEWVAPALPLRRRGRPKKKAA